MWSWSDNRALNPSPGCIVVLKMPSKFSMYPDQVKAHGFIRHLQRKVGTASKVRCSSVGIRIIAKRSFRDCIIPCLLSRIQFGRVLLCCWYFHPVTNQYSSIQRCTRRSSHVSWWRSSSRYHSGCHHFRHFCRQ